MSRSNSFSVQKFLFVCLFCLVVVFLCFSVCKIISANDEFEQFVEDNKKKLEIIKNQFRDNRSDLSNSATFTKRFDKNHKEYTIVSSGFDLQHVISKLNKNHPNKFNSHFVLKKWWKCVKDVDFCTFKKIGSWIVPVLKICEYKKLLNEFAKCESLISDDDGFYMRFKDGTKIEILKASNIKDGKTMEFNIADASLFHIFILRNIVDGVKPSDMVI